MSNTTNVLCEAGTTGTYPSPAPGLTSGPCSFFVLVFCVVFVLFYFVCLRPVSCVPDVACVSILFILDCPFGMFSSFSYDIQSTLCLV